MKEYDQIFAYNNNEININEINKCIKKNPKHKILVELKNTKNINSELISKLEKNIYIRIAGAYDEKRMECYKRTKFHDKFNEEETYTCKEFYYDSVIYSRNELIKILREIERIELGIKNDFSDIQKLMYLYETVKRNIMYDPEYENKIHNKIRTLRSLIEKETVCAGYAVILKELLDRQGIESYYVQSKTHAWNVVRIEDKLFQLDLTRENYNYRNTGEDSFMYFCCNNSYLSEKNIPNEKEPFKDYQFDLEELDEDFIKELYTKTIQEVNFTKTSYKIINNHKEEYLISQIGNRTINNEEYYVYYYVRKINNKLTKQPLILISKVNICGLVDAIEFRRQKKDYNEANAIVNILFSKENIMDSLTKNTAYIGELAKDINNNLEIKKNVVDCQRFTKSPKVYPRLDGSMFVLEKDDNRLKINGILVYRYNIYEYVRNKDKYILKKNIVYSEKDLMNDDRGIIPNHLLSRKRIDDKCQKYCGYIGYIDENGKSRDTNELVRFFNPHTPLTIDMYKHKKRSKITIPNYYEYRKLANKYELINDKFSTTDTVLVADKLTKEIEKDQETNIKAYFSILMNNALNINNEDPNYRTIYDYICNIFRNEVLQKKYIDTVSIYSNFSNSNFYKEILVNLFKTNEYTRFINELFVKAMTNTDLVLEEPPALESIEKADELIGVKHK